MENLPPFEEKKEELYLTDYMKKELRSAANWAIFISISTVLFCSIWGLRIISIFLSSSSRILEYITMLELVGILLLFLVSSLIIISGVLLYHFSFQLKKALNQKLSQSLNQSFDYLSRFFIFSSILLGVVILYTIIITLTRI